jgi:hypothetical protein
MRLLVLACTLTLALTGTIIDRLAIAVGNQAITDGEITREIRLSSLLNGDAPDYSLDSRRKAADRLIEQALVRREMAFSSYPSIPNEQIEQAMQAAEKARGGPDALDGALTQYKLTRQDLRGYLTWEAELLKFIDLRFRPAVQVANADIEEYYRNNVVAASPAGKAPPLNDVRDAIAKKLTGERVDRQLDEWLTRSRARAVIRYVDASLLPVPGTDKGSAPAH